MNFFFYLSGSHKGQRQRRHRLRTQYQKERREQENFMHRRTSMTCGA